MSKLQPLPSPNGTNFTREFLPSRGGALDSMPDPQRTILKEFLGSRLVPEDIDTLFAQLDQAEADAEAEATEGDKPETGLAADSAFGKMQRARYGRGEITSDHLQAALKAGRPSRSMTPAEAAEHAQLFPNANRLSQRR